MPVKSSKPGGLPALTLNALQTGLLLVAWLAGLLCNQPVHAQAARKDGDPFIDINRGVYGLNLAFDAVIVKPVTLSYDAFIPQFAKRRVSNFFNNLDDVNVVINDLLQLKLNNALNDSGRLVVNTTIGIGGLFDVATEMGLYKHREDFGQTLGRWGVGTGPYIVLPFLGSSNVRDAVGLVPDFLLNPVFWLEDEAARLSIYALDTVDTRLFYTAAESMVTGDEYLFVREAYRQRREYLVSDGEVYDEFDDY